MVASEGIEPELLVDVTALLFTSGTIGSVAEAFGVHESSYSVVSMAGSSSENLPLLATSVLYNAPVARLPAVDPATLPTEFLAPVPTQFLASGQNAPEARVGVGQLSTLKGTSFLRQLALLPQTGIAAFVKANPATISSLLASPPQATQVTGWWSGLAASERDALATSAPQLVGGLDGVPASIRNTANLVWLDQSRTSLASHIESAPGRAITEESERQIHMLDEVAATLTAGEDGGPARSLLSVDPTGQGKAAVVLGDLETADYVTYMIPGMFFTVGGQINDWTNDAADLYDEQVRWINLLGERDPSIASKTVAVVSWMGYETPNLTNIGSLDLAYTGRDEIARVVQGLQAEREGNEPRITIVAHSYGSTAALMALTEYSFQIDGLALIGSPGSAAQSVNELHVRNNNVWVGEAAWDPIPNTSFFGSDPGSESYGANTMYVGGGTDPITGDALDASIGHNGYFGAPNLEATRNLALLGIGQSSLITTGVDDADKTPSYIDRPDTPDVPDVLASR